MTPRTLAAARSSRVAAPSLPSPSDEARWSDPSTLPSIIRGDHLNWGNVSPGAHQLAHPAPVQGCPWCPQSEACVLCGKPSPECPDPSGHRRLHGESETSWRERVSA